MTARVQRRVDIYGPDAVLCPACDGTGYLHDGVPLTDLGTTHWPIGDGRGGVRPCAECVPCERCGGRGAIVRWTMIDIDSE